MKYSHTSTLGARFFAMLVVVSLFVSAFPAPFSIAEAVQYPDDPSVEICHATNSDSNPYGPSSQFVNASSIVTGPNGHDNHDGPVFDGVVDSWGDIIPTFDYDLGEGIQHYDGKNWDAAGQEIWNNDCQAEEMTVTLELTKKFSGPVPEGYEPEMFHFVINGGDLSDEVVNLTEDTKDTAVGTIELPIGNYNIEEVGPDDFVPGEWRPGWYGFGSAADNGCGGDTFDIDIVIDEDRVGDGTLYCQVDNQWRYGTLRVIKEFVGTSTDFENFEFEVTQSAVTKFSGPFESDGDNSIVIGEGDYLVEETVYPGYTPSYSDGCSGTMEFEGSGTCTITNTYDGGGDEDVYGCTDDSYDNYDPEATIDDGSCENGGGGQCVDELQGGWADDVYDYSQGTKKDGGDVLTERSNPDLVLDEDDGAFFSLGFGGWISVVFDKYVPDVDGDDISVHEVTNGRDSYPVEKMQVEVSQNGSDWETLSEEATNKKVEGGEGVTLLDFSETGLPWVKYVKFTDTSDDSLHNDEADGFDLDAVDATQELCDEPESEEEPTYLVFGYVWHDENENTEWDGFGDEATTTEDDLPTWTVEITNGEDTYSTTTDEDGYYEFWVPAGTWTITEMVMDGWAKTFPIVNGHVVVVEGLTLTQAEEESFFAMVMDYLVPTAHAQTPNTYGPYNFGNVYTGGSNGGGDNLSCSLSADRTLIRPNSKVNLTWTTNNATSVTIDNGVGTTTATGTVEVIPSSNIVYTLVASDGEEEVTCDVSIETSSASGRGGRSSRGGSSGGSGGGDNDPVPQVLGEQVSAVPTQAPNAGAGGAAQPLSSTALVVVGVGLLNARSRHFNV